MEQKAVACFLWFDGYDKSRHALTYFAFVAYIVLRQHAASKGGIFLNNMQDLTQKERVEEGLLDQLINGCQCDAVPAWHERSDHAVIPMSSNCGTCGCDYDEQANVCGFGVENTVLAAVWAPLNRFEGIYDTDTAMRRGTMFAALDKPFYGGQKEVDCRGNER